ncbi:hypothetical protein AVEN_244051-1 [Araneus ventricosus]|uniref:Uncharacterized protein n=1 Tax=Araneus ventricosus TaxID=182803 RepID=A0A4Y2IHN5_ARAVE|nr:hypothetical protein AVEN_244051-1 [Araneus ventricosus]
MDSAQNYMALSSNNSTLSFGGPALLLSHPTFPSFNSLCLANDKSSYEQLAFSEYVKRDKDIMTSKLSRIDELLHDKLSGANLSDDEGIIPISFREAMDSTEKARTYFFCQKSSENKFNELNSIHNDSLITHKQSARQTTVKDFLN